MSTSNSTNHTNSTKNNAALDAYEHIPCVQYGFPESKGPVRAPKLQTIFDPVPDDANTASPVYLLTQNQYTRQNELENGYNVKDYSTIAKELQDKCEDADRVLYPVHIESDVYHEEGPATLLEWFREFVEQRLGVPFRSCTIYFSGNRSIHVHVPRFVSGEAQREQLKELAETFCTEKGAELDCGLYDRKRMFRLPGVEHAETGLRKVEIGPKWGHEQIFRAANKAPLDVPESYEAVLRHVFASQTSLTLDDTNVTLDPPYDLFQVLDSEKTVLELEDGKQNIETPVIEQEAYPDTPAKQIRWLQYRAKEFSPYALASGNRRSVAAVRVEGGAYARKDVRGGATLVPAYFYAARSCAGGEFTKTDEHAPLQLSNPDFKKWTYEAGDHVVIIGGQSRNSRLLGVTQHQAIRTGGALTGDDGSRQAALSYLETEGYDVGEACTSTKRSRSATPQQPRDRSHIPPVRAPNTEAARLQQQAEQEGIGTLSHDERWRVACRVLWHGWDPAWRWFKQQFGDDFDPEITRQQLRSVVEAYPEDYTHVEVS